MKNKILLVFTALFGLMMLNSGLNKLFKWLFPLVAIVEIVGGVLIAIPKTRALGAIVILPVMVGIVVHHAVHDPGTIAIALIMFAINLWAIIDNKDKYLPMIS